MIIEAGRCIWTFYTFKSNNILYQHYR